MTTNARNVYWRDVMTGFAFLAFLCLLAVLAEGVGK